MMLSVINQTHGWFYITRILLFEQWDSSLKCFRQLYKWNCDPFPQYLSSIHTHNFHTLKTLSYLRKYILYFFQLFYHLSLFINPGTSKKTANQILLLQLYSDFTSYLTYFQSCSFISQKCESKICLIKMT